MSGPVLAERYELGTRLAVGGMSEVWRSRDLLLRRPVAIKLIRDADAHDAPSVARFRAEARYGARLCHPGIVKVYDFCDTGRPFLVLELVNGPSLAQVLANGPLAPRRALELTGQGARALGAAHAAGIVHQDVKPSNLLINRAGEIKLADFGVAQATGSVSLTCDGSVSGTVAYLAPERMLGCLASPASDLYSLGVVLYECLAGRRPFAGSAVEIATAHQLADVPSLPASVPPSAWRLVSHLMAKDPRARPGNAAAVARAAMLLRDQPDWQDAQMDWPDTRAVREPAPGRLLPALVPTLAGVLRPALSYQRHRHASSTAESH